MMQIDSLNTPAKKTLTLSADEMENKTGNQMKNPNYETEI